MISGVSVGQRAPALIESLVIMWVVNVEGYPFSPGQDSERKVPKPRQEVRRDREINREDNRQQRYLQRSVDHHHYQAFVNMIYIIIFLLE
jgi:hypothetical protein